MKLTFLDRFRLAWELTWPLALLDLGVVVLIHGAFDVKGEALDAAWALVTLFGVAPWVVRRALERHRRPWPHHRSRTILPRPSVVARVSGEPRYADWRIIVSAKGAESHRLNYQQSFKVMWLLAWRTIPLQLLAALAISGLFRLTGASLPLSASLDDPLVNQFGLTLIDTISGMVLYPLLIPGMLKKRYKGFHLEVRSTS